MTTGLDERTAAYLTTNRDFCAPSVATAIDALDVPLVVDEPGYHVVQPAVLTTGRA